MPWGVQYGKIGGQAIIFRQGRSCGAGETEGVLKKLGWLSLSQSIQKTMWLYVLTVTPE